MPKQFKGKIALDIRDSVPDWDAFKVVDVGDDVYVDVEREVAAALARD